MGYFSFFMCSMYSINSPVSLSTTGLIISSGKHLCANRLCASFCIAVLRCVRIASWVLDFICAFLFRVLWEVASSLLSFIMRWAASSEDHRGVGGCSTLGGGATLGVIAFGLIVGFTGSLGVGTRHSSGNTAPNICGSATYTFLVCFGGAIGGIRD